MLYERIAKDAINDLTQNGITISEDRLNDAINYAENAYITLQAAYTYNPATDSRMMAQDAAVEYVKAKIMGRNPNTANNFIVAAELWARTAAREVSNTRDKTEWYDQNRFYKDLTTPQ